MTSKHIPLSLLLINILLYLYLYSILINNNIGILTGIVIIFGIGICQHFFLNLVHICTHRLGSRDKKINNLIGTISAILAGFTFSDFSTTHLLHHKFTSDHQKDPDYWITTSGPILTIPFKIFYHDIFFWKNNLWKKGNWINYIVSRVIQITLLAILIINGYGNIILYFWLLPLFIIGQLNGLFLFYLPHYTTKFEDKIRRKQTKNIFDKAILELIDISRSYHEDHHVNTSNIYSYFPVIQSIYNKLKNKKTRKYPNNLKYTNIFNKHI